MSTFEKYVDEYLYVHLKEIIEESDDENMAAFRIAMVISFGHEVVDDIHQMIYTDHLDIDKTVLQNAFNYFTGMGICTFETSPVNDRFYLMGEKDKESLSYTYSDTKKRVDTFREVVRGSA